MKTETETEVMRPQAKEHLSHAPLEKLANILRCIRKSKGPKQRL